MESDYKKLQHENQKFHQQQERFFLAPSTVTQNLRKFSNQENKKQNLFLKNSEIKRCISETNLELSIEISSKNKNVELNQTSENIFEKWLNLFQSYSHKKLMEYKANVLKLNEENVKLREDLLSKEVLLNSLKKSNSILNIDFEECQKLNDELERKLYNFESIIENFKLQSLIEHHEDQMKQQDLILNSIEMDTTNNIEKQSSSVRKSASRNKLSTLLTAAKVNDGMSIYNSFDRITLMNDFNLKSNKSLEKELELLSIKKDAQTQCNTCDAIPNKYEENSNSNQVYSSYKDIFRKIYDTLNSSKTI